MSKNVNFTANQLKLIDWLAATKFDRHPPTQELLAKELDVRPETLTRWKQLPGFQDAVTQRARELLGDALPEIYGALQREAMKGSYPHIRLSLELTGEYVETTKQEHTGGLKIEYVNDWRSADQTDD